MSAMMAAPSPVLLLAWLVSALGYYALAAGDDPAASLLSKVGPGASVSNAKALQGSQFVSYLFQGETLPQDTPLFSSDMAVQLLMQGDGNVVLYNTTKVAAVGYNGASAIWESATYTSSPNPPYSLVMQFDCNLVAYNGLAATEGYSQATAVFYSGTYTDAGAAPCTLVVTSFNGGAIYIQAENPSSIVYQQPAPAVAVPPGSLYNFNGITFSNCGSSYYQSGPTLPQCTFSYAQYGMWTANPAFLNVQNGIQVWTVPTTGKYSFTVLGAAGGTVFREVATAPADLGGRAAAVSGTVALTAGQTLYIVVGQSAGTNINGEPNTVGQFGGGGGGTFVFLGDLSSPLMVAGGGGGGGQGLGGDATAANTTLAPIGGSGGVNYAPQGHSGVADNESSPGSSGLPGVGGAGGNAFTNSLKAGGVSYYPSGGGGGGASVGNNASTYLGGPGGTGTGSPLTNGAYGGFGGGGGSGAAPGQIPTNAATAGFSGGGGGGYSGGHGGGTPNSNTTAVCGSTSSTICSTPAASVPSAGGTSFASGIVSSAAFQLGPPVVGPFPPGGGTVLPQNGYVQVARVS